MFGWLTTPWALRCRHAPHTLLSRQIRPTTPQRLIQKLPGLGSVLYVHDSSAHVVSENAPGHWLVGERALAPLLDIQWLMATSAVTDDGPREWIECIDRFGHPRVRLHLLPDTDYLAWEALVATHECLPQASALPQNAWLRPDTASVSNFRLREFAGLTVLDRIVPVSLSTVGQHVAARIAQAESVSLGL
jgi:hypothetical protein